MIGALATACFVKVYGSVFLGIPRTDAARDLHESPVSMRGPMLVLSAACAVIGWRTILMGPILDNVIANWRGQTDTSFPSLCTLLRLR
jgi:hydrogenase-4 component B